MTDGLSANVKTIKSIQLMGCGRMGIVGFPRVRSRIDRKVNEFVRDQAIHGNLGSPLWFTQSQSAIFFQSCHFRFLGETSSKHAQ